MFVDLHTHSSISDGTLSPKELVEYAKSKDLTAISLTDHDSIDGVEIAIKHGNKIGIEVIPGIELSASFTQYNLHILGYFIDYKNPLFKKELNKIIDSRNTRNKKMLDKLIELGFNIKFDNNISVLTRAHFAQELYKQGYVKSANDAFKKYLSPGKPGYVARVLPTPSKCIDLIHKFGGIACLAHPTLYGVDYDGLDNLIHSLVLSSLDGVEAIYSLHSDIERSHLTRIAKKYNLLVTGGSDFHGSNKPIIDIGKGLGNLKVPYSVVDDMKSFHKK